MFSTGCMDLSNRVCRHTRRGGRFDANLRLDTALPFRQIPSCRDSIVDFSLGREGIGFVVELSSDSSRSSSSSRKVGDNCNLCLQTGDALGVRIQFDSAGGCTNGTRPSLRPEDS
jgi:hypothetical protein